jgi:CheY-like chemotaxis protein
VILLKILLADDENESREYVAAFLRRLGHKVTETNNGQEALDVLATEKFHLLLSDIRMPKLSGIEVLNRIEAGAEGQKPIVVIFTAYSDIETVVRAFRAGAYDYLLKPVNINELADLIEQIATETKVMGVVNDEL